MPEYEYGSCGRVPHHVFIRNSSSIGSSFGNRQGDGRLRGSGAGDGFLLSVINAAGEAGEELKELSAFSHLSHSRTSIAGPYLRLLLQNLRGDVIQFEGVVQILPNGSHIQKWWRLSVAASATLRIVFSQRRGNSQTTFFSDDTMVAYRDRRTPQSCRSRLFTVYGYDENIHMIRSI